MLDFVGRERELARLERLLAAPGSGLVPLYGRRRVGKSELVRRFLRGHRGLYYLGKQAPAGLQVREFLAVAADAVGEPLLAQIAVDGWKQALQAAVERWRGPDKLVLVLDEFQWIVAASPELPSVLQELWDRDWQHDGRVLLILCGSFVGFMEREVLGEKSPLFGRRTAQIHLRPFDHLEARRFHPGYSLVDAARTYFVCGGIPLYLRAFDPGRSVEDNIRDGFLDEFSPLFSEPDFLLREELREVRNYYAILMALAAGSARAGEIAGGTGIPERSLPYYLDQLVKLRYVRRRHPLTGRRPAARDVRFELHDPLLRFWFRFVYPNTSTVAHLGPSRAFEARVRGGLPAYFGRCFEGLCREALPRLYRREGVAASFEVGEYWDRDVQIDVVGLRDDGWADLGECRWGRVRSPAALARELAERRARYPNPGNATIGLRAFTREPFTRPPDAGVRWHDLAALYEE